MKVFIVEDELPARERLKSLLREMEMEVEVVAEAGNIKEAVEHLKDQHDLDLAFFDIQLSDGLSFEIFRHISVELPVIFTTAYDAYLLEAFHTNGIDYLLKPLKKRELARAMQKFRQLKSHFASDIDQLLAQLTDKNAYLRRIAGMRANALVPVKVEEIAWFTTRHKVTLLRTFEDESLVVNRPLANLELLLDPSQFRRINRQYIVNIGAVRNLRPHYKGKLLLTLQPDCGEEVIISQEQAGQVKDWLEM